VEIVEADATEPLISFAKFARLPSERSFPERYFIRFLTFEISYLHKKTTTQYPSSMSV
jgi:hypothetical protein